MEDDGHVGKSWFHERRYVKTDTIVQLKYVQVSILPLYLNNVQKDLSRIKRNVF